MKDHELAQFDFLVTCHEKTMQVIWNFLYSLEVFRYFSTAAWKCPKEVFVIFIVYPQGCAFLPLRIH